MTLNVRPTLSETDAAVGQERRALIEDALAEIAGWKLSARIRAFKRWHDGAFSLIHINLLSLLESESALSMTRLADTLDVSVASATGIVDRMEKRGLVARRHDLNDRRVVLAEATEQGRSVCSQVDRAARDRLGRLLGELTDAELAGFLVGVRGLHAAGARIFGPVPGDAAAGPVPQPNPAPTTKTSDP